MAVTGLVDVAEATKWTGEVDVDPVVGELTVTPAKEAVARARVIISNRTAFFTACTPSELGFFLLEEGGYGFIYSGCIGRLLNWIRFDS
jgi:hypothetical protein